VIDGKLKHLEFIQSTISRMAGNAFLLKGWAVTLVGALVALSLKEVDSTYLLVSATILFFFWMLDGYYLHREKLFRDIYDLVRVKQEEDVDFNMSFRQLPSTGGMFNCLFSQTSLLFYGGIAAAHLVLYHFINC